jgi:hypothetical protein|tara:strand:- start:3695 stop:4708 length:1014 start_codon:yes stop_codon:yes gene_type:complete
MVIKNYLNKLLDLPQMVNEKLPMNNWNSIVENSESAIPNWIKTLFKLLALGLMLGAFLGGLNYLIDTQNGDPIFDMDSPVMVDEYVEREYNEGRLVEGTGKYIQVQLEDNDGNLQFNQEIDEETGELVFEQDMRVFNTGDGFLGSVGYLLALFFWLYALIPLVNVVRFAGNEIASSRGNMLELLIRDVPLALIRAAGYIAALIALFSAIGYTITWLTSINLGVGSNVWGDAGGILSSFSEFSNIGIVAIASLLEVSDVFSSVNPEMLMSKLTDTMSEGSLIGWLDTDDLVIVIGAYWNVVVTLIVLFINLIIWKWVYTLGHTFVKFVSGPYFPHKSL